MCAWLLPVEKAHPSVRSPVWLSVLHDASAAWNKQQAHPNGFAFRAALLVATKRYAKWKYSAGMRRPSPVQESIGELGGFAITLQRVQEKYAARIYLSVRPARHNRTRQKKERHRGRSPIEISRYTPTFIHFTGGFSHSFRACDLHMSRNILSPVGAAYTRASQFNLFQCGQRGRHPSLRFLLGSCEISKSCQEKQN